MTSAKSPTTATSWDQTRTRHRPPKVSTTPRSRPSRTPASVGQARSPQVSSSSPSQPPASPNYFGLVVGPTPADPDSHDPRHAANKFSPSTSTVHSVAAPSPRPADDPDSGFAAFKRRSESTVFSLGRLDQPAQADGQRAAAREQPPLFEAIPAKPASHDGIEEMDIDSAYHSAHSSHLPSQADSPSFFALPRHESPASLESIKSRRGQQAAVDHRQPRLSLPNDKIHPPSPLATPHSAPLRAETLPDTLSQDGPGMINGSDLVELLAQSSERVLLLDLRTYPRFSQSRAPGALNLCIPTTLLKRPSFGLPKLADTFKRDEDRRAFARWRDSAFIVVYDDRSSQKKDAVTCVHTLKKFSDEGWQGHAYILRGEWTGLTVGRILTGSGGFSDFSTRYPDKVDRSRLGESSTAPESALSLDATLPETAPVAGGCPMPVVKSAANPFFGNIRQNMDLIGGVGQIPLKRPAGMRRVGSTRLPEWMRRVAAETDQGKLLSERFLAIEKAEQSRMQDALSGRVSYGPPRADGPAAVQIAGLEKGSKNRYNNIWPYDHARVKLEGGPRGSCDYVNASHITTQRSNKRYIATQGPLPTTFDDFWRVVWEQDVRVIVMLTAESEGGQVKCHAYWKGKTYGALKLQPLSERKVSLEGTDRSDRTGTSEQPYLIVRKFTLSHTSQPFVPMREIAQLQYSSWPDFGAPAHPRQVLSLVEQCDRVVRSYNSPVLSPRPRDRPDPAAQRPVLVHCSAGCGRTGTFCTVDSVLDMLKRQRLRHLHGDPSVSPMAIDAGDEIGEKEDELDGREWVKRDDEDLVAATVAEFRDQRLSMVQSLRQFVLCYETVLEWLVAKEGEAEVEANA